MIMSLSFSLHLAFIHSFIIDLLLRDLLLEQESNPLRQYIESYLPFPRTIRVGDRMYMYIESYLPFGPPLPSSHVPTPSGTLVL